MDAKPFADAEASENGTPAYKQNPFDSTFGVD